MAAIHDLISQIGDPCLRERLAAEWKAASTGKKFGLVFEDHLPELLPLPKAKPRRGDLVIPPFLATARSGGLQSQLANISFCMGVIPPSAMLGRS